MRQARRAGVDDGQPNPKSRKAPIAQALARHKASQRPIDAHFGHIDDEALADRLFTAESDALIVLAETPCASDAEFLEKLRYLLARETRIFDGSPDGSQHFGSILVAVDRQFNADRDVNQITIGQPGQDWGNA